MSYRIDHNGIRELARSWGVRNRVELSRVPRWTFSGQHEYAWNVHRITLDTDQGRRCMADTIAHELCHALQAERAEDWIDWARIARKGGETADRLEREAERFAEAHLEEVLPHLKVTS